MNLTKTGIVFTLRTQTDGLVGSAAMGRARSSAYAEMTGVVITTVDRAAGIGRRIRALQSRSAVVLATTLTLCGCAVTYTDNDGNRHAMGLLDVTVRPPADPLPVAGDVVEITSLGISVGQTAQGGYLTIGFNREATAALRDSSAVLGNPVVSLVPAGRKIEKISQ